MDSLVPFYRNLVNVLIAHGFGGARLNEILVHNFRAQCVQCRIEISAEEIEQIAVSDGLGEPLHPKLHRLRLGYCARQGCESYFYEIHLDHHPDLDWEAITEETNDEMAASNQAKGQDCNQLKHRRSRMWIGLVLLAVAVLALFALQHGALPFSQKPHKYEVDPASAGAGSGH